MRKPLTRWLIGAAFALTSYSASAQIKVAATTGMVADLVKQVGGSHIEVDQLMKPGVDPHLYKPTPQDASRLASSKVIFYSGLMLEGRMGDLFSRLARTGKKCYPITESVDKARLLEPAEFEGHYDPHLWFDVELWSQTIPTIVLGLSEADSQNKADYEKNGAALQAKLKDLHAWCLEKAAELPQEKRILVTSHDAYNYFGRAYGFEVVGLQGVSTVSEAALADMSSLVKLIKDKHVHAIFVESSVNPAAIKRVAQDAGVKIGGELFSDAMGETGETKGGFDVGSYEGMVKYNISTMVNALK
ncbi:MAG: zinc ABC transporter substrate-binding protein [Luteolibacter sp.]